MPARLGFLDEEAIVPVKRGSIETGARDSSQVTKNHEGSLKANNQTTLSSNNRHVSEVSASDANDSSHFKKL